MVPAGVGQLTSLMGCPPPVARPESGPPRPRSRQGKGMDGQQGKGCAPSPASERASESNERPPVHSGSRSVRSIGRTKAERELMRDTGKAGLGHASRMLRKLTRPSVSGLLLIIDPEPLGTHSASGVEIDLVRTVQGRGPGHGGPPIQNTHATGNAVVTTRALPEGSERSQDREPSIHAWLRRRGHFTQLGSGRVGEDERERREGKARQEP